MIGKTLSHYTILEQLGAGGMGVVYRARDERLGRDVALKLLPAEALGSPSARRALEHEARTASALNHPNICTIHDAGEAEGQMFVAMEYVEGRSLAQWIPEVGLPPEQVLRYGMQIADALAHGEQRGIVHRDLKCANVVITPEGRAKVLDFGLAQRVRKEEVAEVTRSKLSLEQAGGIAGTLAYMAPEALRGEPADARSDIWALGVVLYEMATGALPFRGTTGFELSSAILREPLPALPLRVPPALRAVIERCLAKDPAQRYQRAGEVRAALEATETGTRSSAVAAPAPQPPVRVAFWKIAAIACAVVLGLAALLLTLNVGGARDRLLGRTTAPPKIESIAVLPLANMSGDPNQEYFADGMTEALITELAQISAFKKVTSRTSVMLYKTRPKPMPEIANDLGVDAIIEGSVQRAGDKVGITVQLIDPAADRHLWAKSYERDARNILSLQREVARAIANEIKVKLTPQEQSRLAITRPVNPKAHEAYLRGLYAWNKFDLDNFQRARDYFEQAIQIDSGYPSAYVGLADAYAQLAGRISPPAEAMSEAKQAAMKALELNPNLGEAHSSLAYVLHYFEWNWTEAEREFKRALELNPGSARIHTLYAFILSSRGRLDESLAEIRRGEELDPLALGWKCGESRLLYYARRYDQAIELHRQISQLDARVGASCYSVIPAYLQNGMNAQAIELAQASVSRLSGETLPIAWLGHAYARAGHKGKALDSLHKLETLSRERYVSPYNLAVLYIGLGDYDRAVEWLEKAVLERSGLLVYLNVEPVFEPLRGDPRFQAILRRMNLPE